MATADPTYNPPLSGAGGGSGAPTDGTYIVQTANASLSGEQALGSLATGIVKSTTTTGVLSIAVPGTEYVLPTGVAGGQTINGDTAASGTITLKGTAHATPGSVRFGTSAYLETTNQLVIGATAASSAAPGIEVVHASAATLTVSTTATAGTAKAVYRVGTESMGGVMAMGADVSTVGASRAYGLLLHSDQATGLSLAVNSSNGAATIRFYVGSVTADIDEVCRMTATRNLLLGGSVDVASTRLRVTASKTVASATSAIWNGVEVAASTLTLSGTTAITTATGVNLVAFRAPTITAASAVAVTAAATLYVEGPPSAAGSATIASPHALWVQAGSARLGGRLLTSQGADVASGATVTLGNDGNFFRWSGVTNADFMTSTGWRAGAFAVVQFLGGLTINHDTGSPPAGTASFKLAGGANLTVTANDFVWFVFDGTYWWQSTPLLAL